jgi:hypothetical protein
MKTSIKEEFFRNVQYRSAVLGSIPTFVLERRGDLILGDLCNPALSNLKYNPFYAMYTIAPTLYFVSSARKLPNC